MKSVIKVLLTCMLLVSTSVFAATINGSFGVFGEYSATGGSDLSDATTLDLVTVTANGFGTGDINGTITLANRQGTPGNSASLDSFATVTNFFTVAGWTLDLTSLNILDQDTGVLNLSGTGILSGHGFDPTKADWSFSSQSTTSYSMTVTAVPVPAAVWLFGSGLLGLVAVARRKDK